MLTGIAGSGYAYRINTTVFIDLYIRSSTNAANPGLVEISGGLPYHSTNLIRGGFTPNGGQLQVRNGEPRFQYVGTFTAGRMFLIYDLSLCDTNLP